MAQWKTPASSDLVLSSCGRTAYRKTNADWKSIIGTPVFREGVHVFGIKVYAKEGAEYATCFKIGLEENATFQEESCIPETGIHFGHLFKKDHFLREEFETFKSTRDYLFELKVNMNLRTLEIRRNGVWEAVQEAAGRLPDAVSPWVSLGGNLIEVTLLMPCGVPVNEARAELVQDLRALFDSGVMSDVTVLIGDIRIPAHSAILVARSKFFAAMLQAPMKEKATSEIVLEDIDPGVVRWVFQFLYTGDLDFEAVEKQNGLLAMLQAANRYQIPFLEKACAEAMAAAINVENVSDLLLAADSMSCADLRKACLAFVADNAADVQTTDGFKQLPVKRPAILLDVIAAIVPPGTKGRAEASN